MIKDRDRSAREIWEAALGELQIQVNKANYRTWLQPTIGLSYRDSEFVIGVPNTFVAEYLERNQRSLIERALVGLTGGDTKVLFQVVGNGQYRSTGSGGERNKVSPSAQIELPGFNAKYTFDSFVVGDSNRSARDAALLVAQNPGSSYNPLYIYGGAGLGKTHLLHAIGHVAEARDLRVLYASAERFTNEFVHALHQGTTQEFHRKYRTVDILLMDDIQFIGGKEQTEETFFHTFNDLHNANHQMVITSDCSPKLTPKLQNRLRSRLEWGLTVDIQSPGWETRLAILQAKAARLKIDIAPAVFQFLAECRTQNVRELEGSLNRVVHYARLVQSSPTLEIAVQALNNLASPALPQTTLTPRQVIEAAALSFKLTPDDLIGRKRDKLTALARQVAMYLIRQETGYSLKKIGQELGGRDHSTVIHACEKITSSLDSSPHLKRKIEEIQHQIGASRQKVAPDSSD